MNIAILSRGPELYSTQSLVKAARNRGHQVQVIDFLKFQLTIERSNPQILLDDRPLKGIDAIIPRIGASVTKQGLAVVRQFEMMGTYTTVTAEALLKSRDKLCTFQILSRANIGLPKTAFSFFTLNHSQLINTVGGPPLVIKMLQGTHGMGVILAENRNTAHSVMEAFYKARERFVVQEYIKESKGTDIRVLIVNGEVVAAMKRRSLGSDFRANLHRGGKGIPIKLTFREKESALKAATLLGLSVAGVDLLPSRRGPLVLEVNPSPGLEGIETITKVDVAGKIIEFLESQKENGERISD